MALPRRKAPLDAAAVARLAPTVPAWTVVGGSRIERRWKFPDFRSALAFAVRVGEIADREDHHPDITLGWGFATVTFTTHSAKGLTENDFAMAAAIDRL